MPHQTPVRPTRSDGEFAEVFARRTRTPLRGFLPGRRVWNAVGGSAATVLVILGTAALVSRIDFGTGPEKVTTAAERGTGAKAKTKHTGSSAAPTVTASPGTKGGKHGEGPDIVYLPGSGGSGGGAAGGGSAPGGGGTDDGQDTSGDERRSASSETTGSTRESSAGYLWSDGSVESGDGDGYWNQSVVTVKSTKSLTGLKVVVKIVQTGGVADTGVWTSLGDKVSVSSAASGGELDYVVTLKPGVTVGSGTYVLKFGYNHDRGDRDAGGDRYNVTATSTGGTTEYRKGSF
ncbi:hypothetical protein ACIQVC_39010 [Streptomyces sp. NPDC101112]|uniref:hypothetical protein n=1 Tax=Streptomyces sp. NPDC101112 TaxID=3366105 RepID=UPI00382331B0